MAHLEESKTELLNQAVQEAGSRRGKGGPPAADTSALLRAYYRHVAAEDFHDRSPIDVYLALASQYRLADSRPEGTARVRAFTPTVADHGWSAGGHTVIEVVTDDMPFLVDSMTMALTDQDRTVHVVIHPLFEVDRDVAGELREVRVPDESNDPVPGTGGVMSEGSELVLLRESWMHIEIDRVSDSELATIEGRLQEVLRDITDAVDDWPRMRARLFDLVEELETAPPVGLPETELGPGTELLRWLGEDHFALLGFREYDLAGDDEEMRLRAVPGTGLGILRRDPDHSRSVRQLPEAVRGRARDKKLLVLAKANSQSTVHRAAYLDYVGVKKFDEQGEVIGEYRFLGLFSSATYTESVLRIPVLRDKVAEVLSAVGMDGTSHTGKTLVNVLENYPRDELFYTPSEELVPIAEGVMMTRDRRQVRLFTRRETYGRYLSCLVYLPRDRYNTTVRERFATILREATEADSVEFTVRVSEALTAQVHFVVRPRDGELIPDLDTVALERRLSDAARSWRDDFVLAISGEHGEEQGSKLARRYQAAFPEAFKEDFGARVAAADIGRLDSIRDGGLELSLSEDVDAGRGEARLKVYRVGSPLSLSQVLPTLASMGVEVIDERPYELDGLESPTHIYDFGLRYDEVLPDESRRQFIDAVHAVWDGLNEIDGFNRLVLGARLSWRQATVLRAYAKYMKQGNSPFALDYIEEALSSNVDLTRLLVELFEARFDPGAPEDREEAQRTLEQRIERALDDVSSLDHDRILRSYLTHIQATLRTNYFQPDDEGNLRSYMSFKLEPSAIPELPQPRPKFEIFVYSPRVEGVHLRFGTVARGGLRWSDRRDDFRTEVLGLVKAQMVKNTVIVPVGAKGGFFCKQLPDPSDRDAWLAEGVECYTMFISALLDITDNLVDGQNVPPRDVVRHDGDDSYLVVAADKGTATFSDTANAVSEKYGFWLGDAFASGGSVGYDHKAMGITARGAWVSVQRHFREMGIDCQNEDFTAVGIGDMSGDVFGNGMLCSRHTRLVAAFDHRDIFIDPDPDAESSYVERERLFALPRSSWRDYDTSLISEGGGIFSRSAKSIAVTDQMRSALGLADDVTRLTPAEMIRAIVVAPVDLLWNGGIGTYVKASSETNADVGDKGNDAIRVDGRDLRTRCVGEGGNLGLTQLGRIEYARKGAGGSGGRMNTDFIDNSAGVDTSDREVNIKILLDKVVRDGDLTVKQRNSLLAEMTDEVGTLVLRDNYEQNLALAKAATNAVGLLHVHEDWIRKLEREGWMDRELEGLPSSREVRRRLERGQGLTMPELSVLLAWTKIVLAEKLLASDLPDDPFLRTDLFEYFPSRMRQQYRSQMLEHPLRREIIVTQVVNDLINGAGLSFWPRLAGETSASADELTNANFVAREVFGSMGLAEEIQSLDNKIPAEIQIQMGLEMRTLCERSTRWLVTNFRAPLDSEKIVDFFEIPVQRVMSELPQLLTGGELKTFEKRRDKLIKAGAPEDLAARVAVLRPAYMLLGIVRIADERDLDPAEVARAHFVLGESLGIPTLVGKILELPRDDRWQTMARAALRDDLFAVHTQLTAEVLEGTSAEDATTARVAAWEAKQGDVVAKATATLREIVRDDSVDLARVSVALRIVRGLLS